MIRKTKNGGIRDLKDTGDRVQVALRVGAFSIRLCIFDALFERA